MRAPIVSTLISFSAAACGQGPVPEPVALASLSDVSAPEWKALAAKRILFGHQSVGRNLIDGIAAVLASNPEIGLSVRDAEEWTSSAAPGLYHTNIGRNHYPEEKTAAFAQLAASSETGDFGIVKFCYVDVERRMDPAAIFQDYQTRIAELRARNPGLVIVHVTMPLHTSEGTREYWKKKLLRRPNERDRNVARNRYNALLKDSYAGKGPIFDLAAFESLRPDGSRAWFSHRGTIVYEMAAEQTDDGGHLNERARRMIAEQFLVFLSRLPVAVAG